MSYALGLMSGTSMDGIDVAIIDPNKQSLMFAETISYSINTLELLMPVVQGKAFDMHYFAKLHHQIGVEFAQVAKYAISSVSSDIAKNIQVIGSHGQTICHKITDSERYTWQIGCPFEILKACNIPVVYDFRSKNVCEGGQGAPLAPLYHRELFYKGLDCAVINIGGIANISVLKEDSTLGFDTGPGNCLMDSWVYKHFNRVMDIDGEWASTGKSDLNLLNRLLEDKYFSKNQPKSIGKEYFSLDWLSRYLEAENISPQDVQATLVELTALTIANEVKRHLKEHQTVLICGGGAKNKVLFSAIQKHLNHFEVISTDALGIDVNFLEAMMMAWFGYSRIQKRLFDLSKIMGGNDQSLLGIICE